MKNSTSPLKLLKGLIPSQALKMQDKYFLLILLLYFTSASSFPPWAAVSRQVVRIWLILETEGCIRKLWGPLPPKDSWIIHTPPQPPSSLTVAVVSQKSVFILAPQVLWLPACGPHWLDAVAMETAF